ncbi:DUF1800 domain-containing protein [Solimonas marina]|uniref:DUF1800 domain-containing protein n=1 Tax=Solimonas marina TaxID=2714601 RepID=A0A969WCM0_9GAMM|nr:DUF1800 domain-containing protein [Solimonas marina]NKF22380.1 DUF1800 domain-containing protein [Solimonas marina]
MWRYRFIATLLGLSVTAAPAWALTDTQARQLLWRTGFDAPPERVSALRPLSQGQAVDRLVDAAADDRLAKTPAPDWVGEPITVPFVPKDLGDDEKQAFRRMWAQRDLQLQAWWMQEMLTTETPLAERMTLFWHGHFTSSLQSVRAGQLMYRQNVMLRANALGNYRTLLHEVAHDPAMLRYLNNQQNRKGAPNENFARELLELFTLGEGHYSEHDMQQAARAFTGWKALPPDGRFVEVRRQHDDGIKSFLGQRGNFDGDDIIDIILRQPQAAVFIVDELWHEFVSPNPDPSEVERLASSFRKDWQIAPLMKQLLREPEVIDARSAGTLVKSPVEFVVGTVRSIGLPLTPLSAVLAADSMGQALFYPPNVKGWPGGDGWITSDALLSRRQFVLALAGDAPMVAPQGQGREANLRKREYQQLRRQRAVVARRFGEFAESLPPDAALQMLALNPVQPPVDGAKPPDRLETWLLDPVYNLK